MTAERIRELLDEGVDVDWFADNSREQLCAYLANLKAHRCRLDAVEANVLVAINRLDRKSCPSAKPSDTADDVKEQTGESGAEANRKARRAELFDRWPQITAALAEGRIGAGHADLLSSVPAKFHDQLEADLPALLLAAAGESVDEFKKSLRLWRDEAAKALGGDPHRDRIDRRHVRMSDQPDGMGQCVGTFDPESFAIVRNTVSARAQQLLREDQERGDVAGRTHGQRMADAFADICRSYASRNTTGAGQAARGCGSGGAVVVTIGLDQLLAGSGGHILGGGPLSAAAVRRLACENGVIPLVLGADSAILDMGRRTRVATPAQRLALAVRHGGHCAAPGCDRPFEWCHIHHIQHWSQGGTTDIDNLIPLCTRHHTQIHEGQLHHRRHNGADQWRRPSGSPESERKVARSQSRKVRTVARVGSVVGAGEHTVKAV